MLRIVKTENGFVRGIPGSDVRNTIFKGIPYADNTSGENRWRAPQPAKSWEGIRDCSRFSPITMQKIPGQDPDAFYSKEWHVEPEIEMSEDDSLTLNIWTPAKTGEEMMPVMIWIFGGGLFEGYAHEMEFDGESFNRRGVILVSIAYRLNVFGFLAHPELTAADPEHPTNFGLLDQKAGIEWVKRNIIAFGGDPDNITIFGQSAGAGSTMYHMTSPQSAGLFKRAIAMSGGGIVPVHPKAFSPIAIPMEVAEASGVKFIKDILGCDSIDEARKLDAAFIRDKFLENMMQLPITATIDGKFILDQWYQRVLDDKVNDADLMTGNTGGEFPMVPDGDVEAWIKQNLDEYADEYLALCKAEVETAGQSGEEALRKAASINGFELSALAMAKVFAKHGKPVYYYRFDPTIPGDDAGSFHSSDLWFCFETLMKCWRPFDGHHYDLARQICNYWANYAKTGNPNGPDNNGNPMPEWRKYTEEDPDVIYLEDQITSANDKTSEKVKFLVDINLKEYEY